MNNIAHVGHTGTDEDACRIAIVWEWLIDQGVISFEKLEPEFIDLNHGRDFLTETNQYEVVVLHYLFRGSYHMQKYGWLGAQNEMKVSLKNSWENWVKRLDTCGARFVFAFGSSAEVSGQYLVNLPQYDLVCKNWPHSLVENDFCVFVKKTKPIITGATCAVGTAERVRVDSIRTVA